MKLFSSVNFQKIEDQDCVSISSSSFHLEEAIKRTIVNLIEAREPDIIIIKIKKIVKAIPGGEKIPDRQIEIVEKSLDLKREVKGLWYLKYIQVVHLSDFT